MSVNYKWRGIETGESEIQDDFAGQKGKITFNNDDTLSGNIVCVEGDLKFTATKVRKVLKYVVRVSAEANSFLFVNQNLVTLII